ncbi:hypothetical protein VTK56DRAFT_9697 [Thermocarpiscus australiensis]
MDDWAAVLARQRNDYRRLRQQTAEHWSSFIEEQYNDGERHILGDFDIGIKTLSDRMTDIFKAISDETDEHESLRLCGDMPNKKKLTGKIWRAITAYLIREYDAPISPAVLHDAILPDAHSPIVNDIDFDANEANAMQVTVADCDSRSETISREAAGCVGSAAALTQDTRRNGREAGTSPSRPKRARYSYHQDRFDDVLPPMDSSDSECSNDRTLDSIRTISSTDVEGLDYIFRYPRFGPGHFVIRCDADAETSSVVYRFEGLAPLSRNRAIKHFSDDSPKQRCHDITVSGRYTEEEIVRKFGYRVVDEKGNNVTREWAARSNGRLQATRKKAQGKQKAPVPPKSNVSSCFDRPSAAAQTAEENAAAASASASNIARAPVADMGVDGPESVRQSQPHQ